MADYTVNNLYDMIDACNEISSEEYTDVETNIYIEKDIDLNDYSEYWVITQTLFKITTRLDNQKITIHGKGRDNINGTPHTIRNIYLVNGFVFDIIPYTIDTTTSTVNKPSVNRTFIINDLNVECLIHKNSVDTRDNIGMFRCNRYNGNNCYITCLDNIFNNCTFNIKSFQSNYNDTSIFNWDSFIYLYFNGCIFNVEHKRLVPSGYNENFGLFYSGYFNVTIRHCQINIRLFILDNSTGSGNYNQIFIDRVLLFNCFIRVTLEANASEHPFYLIGGQSKLENTYFIIKPPANPNTNYFPKLADFRIQSMGSSYTICCFYVSEVDDLSDLISLTIQDYFKKIESADAKNAEYLTINVPFIIKT